MAMCGVAVVGAIFAVTLKKHNPEYSMLISLCAGVLMLYLLLTRITPAVSQIRTLLSATGLSSDYGAILFKALGICFLTQFAADSCRDAGESAVASKIELGAKAAMIVMALPVFDGILGAVGGLLL